MATLTICTLTMARRKMPENNCATIASVCVCVFFFVEKGQFAFKKAQRALNALLIPVQVRRN